MVFPDSDKVPRASPYLGTALVASVFAYGTITLYGLSSQIVLLTSTIRYKRPATPERNSLWFRLFQFRSPLLSESQLIYIPLGTKMFQFPRLAPYSYEFTVQYCRNSGFPHSDIPGSKSVRRLPEAYRSLPRLSSPLSAKASTMRP